MSYRFHYLEHIAQTFHRSYDSLIKREAEIWIDETLEHITILYGDGENSTTFGFRNQFGRSSIIMFKYKYKHCHIYFNDAVHPDNHVYYMLRKVFLMPEDAIDHMLRLKFKKYLKKYDINPERKIKFFYQNNL